MLYFRNNRSFYWNGAYAGKLYFLKSTWIFIFYLIIIVLNHSNHYTFFQWLNSLGGILYRCLDYGLSEGEERELSSEVINLIEELTTPLPKRDDEGIDGLEDGLPLSIISNVREVNFVFFIFVIFFIFMHAPRTFSLFRCVWLHAQIVLSSRGVISVLCVARFIGTQ